MSEPDYIFKIVIAGSGGVGKTALSRRFFESDFRTDLTQTTLRVSIFTKKIIVNGKIVRLVSLDTAGQEYYGRLRTAYYLGAKGALLLFDLTQHRTLQVLDGWLKELKDNTSEDISIIL
ncbi:MAG: Rab family GTPase, partial [Promethearchaeota archaeon]